MRNPFVLIVIPFKNEVPLLLQLVNSITKSYISGFSWSIMFWDDGSRNDQIDLLWNSVSKDMVIFKHDNVGYTQAVWNILNFSKGETQFDHLLLLNSDIKFETGTFFSMVKRSVSNPNIAAVGGKILKYDTNEILHTGTRIKNGEIDDPYCKLDRNDPQTNFTERRLWVNGSATLYKLDVLRKENLNFDLDFSPAYFEEADLMSRLNMLGYAVMYEPRAVIHHVMNATHNKERDKYEKVFWTNWQKYLEKWKPLFNSKQLQF
jgi:GT2 family glycosyltransferase